MLKCALTAAPLHASKMWTEAQTHRSQSEQGVRSTEGQPATHPDPKPPSPMSRHSRTPAELLSPPMPWCFTAAHYCIFLIIIIIPSESVCLFQYKNTNQSFIQLNWSCSYRASFCRKILCLQELVHWFGNNNRQLSGAIYDPGDWFYYNE